MKISKKLLFGTLAGAALVISGTTAAWAKPPPRSHSGGPIIIWMLSAVAVATLVYAVTKGGDDRPTSP